MLKNPKHGFGSGMNPCIDCRAMMFKAAKKQMDKIGAEFIISGEVLGQRPMSQHGPALKTIEKESDLEGLIVRPLSAGLLGKTEPEKNGLIKREDLGMISGRRRIEQLQLAKEYGIEDPPNAGGGCLLTDPAFSLRAKDLFSHIETPTINDIDLLKIGRHFRLDPYTKLVVGRNHNENEMIKSLAYSDDVLLEVRDHVGPVSILRGKNCDDYLDFGAQVTMRYSDAPKPKASVVITEKNGKKAKVLAKHAKEATYIKYRI